MSNGFVPIVTSATAAAYATGDAFPRIVVNAVEARPFQPVLPVLPHGDCASSASPSEPKVTVARNGDRVSSIKIQCSCGQTVELALAGA